MVIGLASDALQVVEHVVQAHALQAVEQRPAVFKHHARLFAFVNQLRDELARALVAPMKDRSVVIIPDAWVVHHVLQVANNFGGGQIAAFGWNERLVHVERVGERAADAFEINPGLGQENALAAAGSNHRIDLLFRATKVRQPANGFW